MPWSGGSFSRTDGTRTGTTVWAQAKNAGVKIVTSGHDTHDQDLATGINTCLTKDGQNSPTANLPMGGFKHTGVNASAGNSSRTEYICTGSVQDSDVQFAGTSSGAANVYACSLSPAITAYVNGMQFSFAAHQTSTDACTLNVNGVGALNMKVNSFAGITDAGKGDIRTGYVYNVVYDSSGGGQFLVLNPYKAAKTTTSISAAGATQGTATALTTEINSVSTVVAGADGVRLPTVSPGLIFAVWNEDPADTLNVYPATGENFVGVAANTATTIAAGAGKLFVGASTTAWFMFAS